MSVTGVPDRGGAHYFFGFFFCFTELRMTFGYQFSCLDDVFWLLFAGIMALAKQFSLPNLGFWFLWCGRRNPWTPRPGRKKTRQSSPQRGRKKLAAATEPSPAAAQPTPPAPEPTPAPPETTPAAPEQNPAELEPVPAEASPAAPEPPLAAPPGQKIRNENDPHDTPPPTRPARLGLLAAGNLSTYAAQFRYAPDF